MSSRDWEGTARGGGGGGRIEDDARAAIGDGGAGRNDEESDNRAEDGVARAKVLSHDQGVAQAFDAADVDTAKEDKATADEVSHGCLSRLKASQEPGQWECDAVAAVSGAKSKLQKLSMYRVLARSARALSECQGGYRGEGGRGLGGDCA